MDEQYLRKTEDRLYEELSFALGKKKEDMESYIIEQIEGKEKRCKWKESLFFGLKED